MGDHDDEEVKLERLPAMRVACVAVNSSTPEWDSLSKMKAWAESKGLMSGPYRLFGYDSCLPDPDHTYTVWLTVGPDVEPEGDFEIKEFPGGLFAALPITGIPAIGPGWRQVAEWSRRNGHRCNEALPCLEEALDPIGTPEDTVRMKLYYALAE
ncbi:MAG: GyrI-like domain-containing protein [Anaerolineae bacterium]|nr:GyrI-like domain-containing protein [Anaerolineae bacterium]